MESVFLFPVGGTRWQEGRYDRADPMRSAATLVPALLTLALGPLAPQAFGSARALAQEKVVNLDTLRVQVGSRASPSLPLLTRSIRLLGTEALAALPARSLPGLLGWATGVDVLSRSPAQHDLSIRGAGFEQVLVLVNGIRMSDPQTGHFDLNLGVPMDQVERLEILRGSASALYGADAMGGVVNIVTHSSPRPWEARLEGGSWGTARLAATGGVGEEGQGLLRVAGEVSRSDGHRPGTDYEAALLHLTGSHPVAGGSLSGDMGFSRRDFGARDFYAPYPSFERTRSVDGSLRWRRAGQSGTSLEAGLSFRSHDDEFILLRDDPSFYRNQHTSSQGGLDLLGRIPVTEDVSVAAGAELFGHLLRSNSLGNREEARGALFSELALGRGRPGLVSLGLRGDWHEGFGMVVSPSVSASRLLTRALRIRASAGGSFRAPTWTERYYRDPVNVGRADLSPERAWSGEVGVDLFPGQDAQLAVTAFGRRATDLIDWARSRTAGEEEPWETRNVAEATFLGLEGDLAFTDPIGTSWELGASVLSLETDAASAFVSKYALRPVMERVRLRVRRSLPRGTGISLQGQRARRRGQEAYHTVDLRLHKDLGRARLYLDATNLTDQAYADVTGARAPGRAFFLGVKTAWGGVQEETPGR